MPTGVWKREPLQLEGQKLFLSLQQEIWISLLCLCFLSPLFASVCFPFLSVLSYPMTPLHLIFESVISGFWLEAHVVELVSG